MVHVCNFSTWEVGRKVRSSLATQGVRCQPGLHKTISYKIKSTKRMKIQGQEEDWGGENEKVQKDRVERSMRKGSVKIFSFFGNPLSIQLGAHWLEKVRTGLVSTKGSLSLT